MISLRLAFLSGLVKGFGTKGRKFEANGRYGTVTPAFSYRSCSPSTQPPYSFPTTKYRNRAGTRRDARYRAR